MTDLARILLGCPSSPTILDRQTVRTFFRLQVLRLHSDKGGIGDMQKLINARELLFLVADKTKICKNTCCVNPAFLAGLCKYHNRYVYPF